MTHLNQSLSLILVGLATAIVVVAQHATSHSVGGGDPFTQIQSLVGTWEAIQDGVVVSETYTLTANGTALMAETRPRNEPAMITLFTVDGDHLIATHYCVAGNQPQMVSPSDADLNHGIAFTLTRVTGMKTQDDWHNTGLTITLDDTNHMTQRWTYRYKGTTGVTVFHYTRTQPGQAPPRHGG